VLILGFFGAVSVAHSQTTRYVATGGSDAGNCADQLSPCETIAHALDVADSGDTIEIAAGNYGPAAAAPDSGLFINKEISLIGAGPTETQVGRGFMHPDTRIFTIATGPDLQVSIAGMTIRDGISASGGGIFVTGDGQLTLSDVVFDVNFASNGGAIFNRSSVILDNVDFVDNISVGRGGAIYNTDEASLNISGGKFVTNEAGIFGGAIFNNDDNLLILDGVEFNFNEADSGCGAIAMNNLQAGNGTFSNVTFMGNSAGGIGGALCLDNSAVVITDSAFMVNQSHATNGNGYGGAIRAVNGSNLTLDFVAFQDNYAEERGGAIYSAGATTVTMEDAGFKFNFTLERGGAIYFRDESALEASQTLFEDNAAGVFGGAIFATNDPVLDLDSVTFESNEAEWGCGAININNLESGNGSITNVDFLNNSAGGVGGALCLDNSAPSITSTTFEGNQSLTINGNGRGGAIRSVNSSGPTLTNVQFINNFATQRGGGLYSSASAAFLNDVLFTANKTNGEGGGMASMSGGGRLTNVTFSENEASSHGGGLYLNGTQDMSARNVVFDGNESNFAGGGMANTEAASPLLVNVLFTANSAATSGGGMFNTVQSNPLLYNVTFTRNLAPDGGGMANTMFSTPELVNTLLWGNFATTGDGNEFYSTDSSWPIRHFSLHANEPDDFYVEASIIPACNQCAHSDPLFVDGPGGNYRLQATSPAVDAGDPDTDPMLFPDGTTDPVDLDGQARYWGDYIDIGAYEWQPPSDKLFSDRFEE
jgi:predicted outer membrane repeat protein